MQNEYVLAERTMNLFHAFFGGHTVSDMVSPMIAFEVLPVIFAAHFLLPHDVSTMCRFSTPRGTPINYVRAISLLMAPL